MKKSVVLLALLAGLVVFAMVYQKSRNQRMNSARLKGVAMRELLLPDLAVKDIRKIRIREGKFEANLAVQGDRWVVVDRSGYPAAFDRINRAVENLSQTRINAKNEVGESVLGQLKLLAPAENVGEESSGLQVELMNEKGESLGSFVAGVSTQTTGGANSGNWMGATEQRYVRTPDDASTVWLTNNAYSDWSADPKEWTNKAFITANDIMGMGVKGADAESSWQVGRADVKDGFIVEGATADQELEPGIASMLPNLLSGIVFSDVHPGEKEAELMKNPITVTAATAGGFNYQLKVAEKPVTESDAAAEPSVYLTVKAATDIPAERPPEKDEKPEEKTARDEAFANLKKKAEEQLAKEKQLEGWVFEVPKSSLEAVFKKRSEVLVKKGAAQQDAPPQQPGGGIPGLPPGFQLPGMPGGGQ